MASFTWKYQILCLLSLLLHSQVSFPSSFSSSLSSMSPCFALLQFNKSLSLDYHASTLLSSYRRSDKCEVSYPKTASWMEDKECCSWDGVECDKTTGHVIGLDLGCSWLSGPIHSNSSLFFLRHLRRLNLAGNNFIDSLLPSEFGKFKSLTHLNLSYSEFSGQISYEISQLSSLVSLDLSHNNELLIETPVWKNLTQLRELLLDGTNMPSIRPNSLMNLSSSLTTLSLKYCGLQGKLEDNILCLPSLQTLNLGANWQLEGSLPISNCSSSLKFLDLSYTSLSGELPDSIGYLKSLKYLDLRMCNFMGSIPASLGNLTQITYLYLSYNNFTGSIPASLGNLTQITYLDLSNNNFTGSIPASLGNLTQITYLDLSNNNFSGLLSSSLLNMPMLSTLYLDHNQLVGPLPNSVSGLLNLATLNLNSNFLNGTLPSWLFSLPSLVTLRLTGNQLSGEIGEFKSNSLDYLDLSGNMLHGSIPRSISKLVNLTQLYLSSNNLSIMLESESFSKLQQLGVLDFSNNNLFVSINNNVTYTMPNLFALSLSSCNITEFPLFLRMTTNLASLDLSNNRIHGQVPRWLGDVGRDSLRFLDLRNNLLQGPFPTLNFTWLRYFFVSNNKLSEEIPSSICNASSLEVLDLSYNKFSGMIPKCLVHFSVSLSVLDLRMNSLHGTIPTRFAKGNNLRNLNLNGNQLEGPLPQSLANCSDLQVLDLGNNRINGTFPYWLGSLPNLQVLVLRSNRFHGLIGNPTTKFPFPNLRILDLSTNMFSGPLPGKYFKYLKAMTNVEEGEVQLKYMGDRFYQDSLKMTIKGQYIELERIQTFLTTIDFSKNSFRGEIPKIIGRLKSLKGLNFSHNNLTGYIPSSFGNLTNLEWLDLSSNKLTGEIPTQLVDLPWLEVLNLSQNQLTGHIPTGKQFNTFENDSYTGNLGLCGYPLSRMCNNHEAKQPPLLTLQQEDNLEPNNGFGWKAVLIGYGCGVIFGMFMGYIMFKIGKPKWLVRMVMLEQHIMLRRLNNNAHRRGGRR